MSHLSAAAAVNRRKRILEAVRDFPRVSLGNFPTPLEECPNLSKRLGGPRLYIKRDDCTGLALGGNKVRSLEFSIGEALKNGADVLLAGAGIQSNYCRQAAAAAARIGLPCYLLLTRRTGHGVAIQGNLLLDHLFGAHVRLVDAELGEELEADLDKLESELCRAGKKPYNLLNPARYYPLAALSSVLAFIELADQAASQGLRIDYIYHAAAGPTQAGLVLAARLLESGVQIRGIAPIRWRYDLRERIAETATSLSREMRMECVFRAEDIYNTDAFVGDGYGKVTSSCLEAIKLLAETEGIILDPVYTGKAFAAVVEDIRSGLFTSDETVVFIHTGGIPAIFAYNEQIGHFLGLSEEGCDL